MDGVPKATWEKVCATCCLSARHPSLKRCAGLLGALELNGPSGLPPNDRGPVPSLSGGPDVVDPKPCEIAGPELAVDREVEERQVPGEGVLQVSDPKRPFGSSGLGKPSVPPAIAAVSRSGASRQKGISPSQVRVMI